MAGSGQAVVYVSVVLKDTPYGASTNENGQFELQAPAGEYVLAISSVGLEKKEMAVAITANQTTTLPNITLAETSQRLSDVVVQGNRDNILPEKESDYVAKLPLQNLENPQVYNNISAELLRQQVVTSFNDALNNAPGLTRLWESTGRGGDGAGYFSLRGFAVQPTMLNGLPGLTNGGLDPANIENIEVIKGPSGTLYGSSLISYGGLINVVTKKPYESFGGELSYITGSFGLNRITADVNTPVTKERNVLFRLNTAYHRENSFQDAGFRKLFFVAPSLSYQVNDKLSFLVITEFLASESTNQTMLFLDRGAPLTVSSLDALGYDPERSYTSNDLSIKNPTFNLQAQMLYALSDHWKSQTALSRGSAQSEGYYSYLYEATQYYPISEGSIFGRYISKQNAVTLSTDLQQNFIGDFNIGNIRNRMVIGFDYLHTGITDNSTGYVGNGSIYIGEASVEEVNQVVFGITEEENYITNNDSGILSRPGTDALLAGSPVNNSTSQQEIVSAYVSDVINVTPALSAMASIRIDRFIDNGEELENGQTALSPKFGLVYQPIPDQVSLFANYMNGFSNVAPRRQEDGSIQSFDPEQANQWEVGVKINTFNDQVVATVSYYDIMVSNVVRDDPDRPLYYIQDGENYSKGFELSVIANPAPGLNFIAGYSYNDSEISNTNPEYNGRRPENAGSKHLVNGWISYHFPAGPLKGFGLGFGGNYASEYATLDRVTTGTFILPAYTVLNTSVFYSTNAFRLALKLDNLNDEIYYKGWSTINPQKPRSLSASFSYRF